MYSKARRITYEGLRIAYETTEVVVVGGPTVPVPAVVLPANAETNCG